MAQRYTRSRPTFHWQAILILLPLVILVVVGGWSLQQDRWLAEQEARERARQYVELLSPRLIEWVQGWPAGAIAAARDEEMASASPSGSVAFQVSARGALLKPAAIPIPVPKPLDTNLLSPEAAELWEMARTAEFNQRDWVTAQTAYRQFLETRPTEVFAAAAACGLARTEWRLGRHAESVEILAGIIKLEASVMLESGLPAQAVAGLQWMELARTNSGMRSSIESDMLDVVCSNAVSHPSFMSEPLLTAIAGLVTESSFPQLKQWQKRWQLAENARRLHAAVRQSLPHPEAKTLTGLMSDPQLAEVVRAVSRFAEADEGASHWIMADGVRWLVVREENSAEPWIVCIPEAEVGEKIQAMLRAIGRLPSYFGIGITMAARQYRVLVDQNGPRGLWRPLKADDVRSRQSMRHSVARGSPDRLPEDWNNIVLASQTVFDAFLGEVAVDIYLDQPSLLFARQRTRTYWFGGLIATSAVAAMTGLVTGWRAFHQQQRLVEMQSRFVSSVSHELRAPIASIRLLAEGLESGRIHEPEKQAEYFELMSLQCRRLTALIENILDFSRIEQGRKLYEFELADVGGLVRQTVRLMEPLAEERKVTLSIFGSLETNGCYGRVDGRALQQALVNLIDNAIKHAPANSTVEVGIACESRKAAAGDQEDVVAADSALRIWVSDCGDGIPATEHEKIFEPFYRRGSELRRETIGIGIGLSIVKHVVEAHGGRVTVESEPGRGSKFMMHIPSPHCAHESR